jgi:hypothetical protein
MRVRKGRNLFSDIIIGTMSLLVALPLFADTPRDRYHVTYGPELRTALNGTIGVLTLTTLRFDTAAELKVYSNSPTGPGERPDGPSRLGVLNATTPISNYGYYPPFGPYAVDAYRYPVTARQGRYLQIVIDPIENQRRWLDMEEVEKDFRTSVVLFDSLASDRNDFVEVFRFAYGGECRLYKAPADDAGFKTITKDSIGNALLRVIEVRGGFAHIATFRVDYQLDKPIIVPLGWIRIRDDDGAPLIWIYGEDSC